MKKGFTITELLVAVGLLAVVLAAAGIVFRYSIDAQRTASATAEIMRTLRAITDQLNADFTGIQKDAPMVIRFEGDPNDSNKADSVVFFATGDFQTTNLYGGQTIRGNVARIYYGQAEEPDPNSADSVIRRIKVLARRQVILAPSESTTLNPNEYEPNSLSQQVNFYLNEPSDVNELWLRRPNVDPNDENDIPMYFAKGVDDFSIMFCDHNDINTGAINWQTLPNGSCKEYFISYPDLIKFTFTLYDSKGILKNGRRFEHIVYIGK